MAEFAAKCEFFAQKYGMWFSDQHKQDARVAFDIFSFGRTDLCYSELFLKAISRAMKSALKVKIGTIVRAALKDGIRNPESGIRNPETEYGIRNQLSMIEN